MRSLDAHRNDSIVPPSPPNKLDQAVMQDRRTKAECFRERIQQASKGHPHVNNRTGRQGKVNNATKYNKAATYCHDTENGLKTSSICCSYRDVSPPCARPTTNYLRSPRRRMRSVCRSYSAESVAFRSPSNGSKISMARTRCRTERSRSTRKANDTSKDKASTASALAVSPTSTPSSSPTSIRSIKIHNAASSCWERHLFEVMPGHEVPLIGTRETWHAFHRNHCINVKCSGCDLTLCCIDKCSMVVCPTCRCIFENSVACSTLLPETLGVGLSPKDILRLSTRSECV